MASDRRGNVTAEVDLDVHKQLRVALLQDKLPEKNFSEWLRAREREAVVGLVSQGKRK